MLCKFTPYFPPEHIFEDVRRWSSAMSTAAQESCLPSSPGSEQDLLQFVCSGPPAAPQHPLAVLLWAGAHSHVVLTDTILRFCLSALQIVLAEQLLKRLTKSCAVLQCWGWASQGAPKLIRTLRRGVLKSGRQQCWGDQSYLAPNFPFDSIKTHLFR